MPRPASTSSCTPPARCRCRRRWPGADARGVFGVQTLDDGAALRAWLDVDAGSRSGRSSSAAATSASRWPRRCTTAGSRSPLVEQADQPMSTVDPDMGALVARGDARAWASTSAPARRCTASEQRDGRVAAVVTDARHRCRPTSSCSASGVRPNTALAEAAGLPARRPTGGVRRRPADAGGRASRASGRPATASRPSTWSAAQPVHVAARHARQQAGPGRRDQHRRRLRDVPGRHRHGRDQGVRPRGRAHRAERARGRPGRLRLRHGDRRVDQPGRLLPRRASR